MIFRRDQHRLMKNAGLLKEEEEFNPFEVDNRIILKSGRVAIDPKTDEVYYIDNRGNIKDDVWGTVDDLCDISNDPGVFLSFLNRDDYSTFADYLIKTRRSYYLKDGGNEDEGEFDMADLDLEGLREEEEFNPFEEKKVSDYDDIIIDSIRSAAEERYPFMHRPRYADLPVEDLAYIVIHMLSTLGEPDTVVYEELVNNFDSDEVLNRIDQLIDRNPELVNEQEEFNPFEVEKGLHDIEFTVQDMEEYKEGDEGDYFVTFTDPEADNLLYYAIYNIFNERISRVSVDERDSFDMEYLDREDLSLLNSNNFLKSDIQDRFFHEFLSETARKHNNHGKEVDPETNQVDIEHFNATMATEDIEVNLYPGDKGVDVFGDEYLDKESAIQISLNDLVANEPLKAKLKDKEDIKSLIKAYKSNKKVNPILVRQLDDKYQILDGHHRFLAAKAAGLDSLNAIVIPEKSITKVDDEHFNATMATEDVEEFNPFETEKTLDQVTLRNEGMHYIGDDTWRVYLSCEDCTEDRDFIAFFDSHEMGWVGGSELGNDGKPRFPLNKEQLAELTRNEITDKIEDYCYQSNISGERLREDEEFNPFEEREFKEDECLVIQYRASRARTLDPDTGRGVSEYKIEEFKKIKGDPQLEAESLYQQLEEDLYADEGSDADPNVNFSMYEEAPEYVEVVDHSYVNGSMHWLFIGPDYDEADELHKMLKSGEKKKWNDLRPYLL